MESEISSIEKRFAYGFLQKLLKWMEIAQEFIAHLGNIIIKKRKYFFLGFSHMQGYRCVRVLWVFRVVWPMEGC